MVTLYYSSQSNNTKTGNIPQQWIGATPEETRATCEGCALLTMQPDPDADTERARAFGFGCYAHYGRPRAVIGAIRRAEERNPGRYSLENALRNRLYMARYLRFAAIGDPAGVDDEVLRAHETLIRKSGLGILSYTHFWRTRGRHLIGRAMASCDTWRDAKDAIAGGWRAVLYVRRKRHIKRVLARAKKRGWRAVVCPADLQKAQCATCGLCDAATHKDLDLIVFLPK